jgi:outer membrane protein OmpA-like peptidoglycan-associated protein
MLTGYGISSTGGAIASYSISPAISNTPGLSFSTSSGRITGAPMAAAVARTYTITATNAAGSASATFELTVNAPPPPSVLKTLTYPKISRDTSSFFCSAGTYVFIRNGYNEETPKITAQKYFLVQDGKIVDTVQSLQQRVTFENKSTYQNTTMSCQLEVYQESIQSTVSSQSSKTLSEANEVKKLELQRVDEKYYSDRTVAYAKKDKEFARIEEVKKSEIAAAKTASDILTASDKYQKAFSAASELWKLELQKATTDRDLGREEAQTSYLKLLEKSGISIFPVTPKAVVTPTPTPTVKPTPTPSPTASTNTQPTTQMEIVGTVYMASGSYFLNDETKKTLIAVAKKINVSGAKSILVYGHADNRGGVNNTALSQNRAKAVANYLRPLLTVKKISIGWYSSNKPAVAGTSAAALAQNRRVEIYTK